MLLLCAWTLLELNGRLLKQISPAYPYADSLTFDSKSQSNSPAYNKPVSPPVNILSSANLYHELPPSSVGSFASLTEAEIPVTAKLMFDLLQAI